MGIVSQSKPAKQDEVHCTLGRWRLSLDSCLINCFATPKPWPQRGARFHEASVVLNAVHRICILVEDQLWPLVCLLAQTPTAGRQLHLRGGLHTDILDVHTQVHKHKYIYIYIHLYIHTCLHIQAHTRIDYVKGIRHDDGRMARRTLWASSANRPNMLAAPRFRNSAMSGSMLLGRRLTKSPPHSATASAHPDCGAATGRALREDAALRCRTLQRCQRQS